MRRILSIVAVGLIGGCAGTTARAPRNIPIVSQRPSISKRLEAQRQHQNEVEIIGRTEVQGSLIR